jgi:hypothetical protein
MPLWKRCVGFVDAEGRDRAATEANFTLHPITATRGEWVGHIGSEIHPSPTCKN